MGVSSSVGVASGIDYGTLIDQLMALEAKPRDMLKTRTDTLKKEQSALQELTALLLSTQYVGKNLGKEELFAKRTATSSNSSALTATVTGTPAVGSYQYTPIRTVQNQQFLSSGVRSSTEALGGGTIRFRFGDNVERSANLSLLGGAAGVSLGKIRITDRSGTTAQIDLSTAQTIDDVLEAINGQSTVNVTAVADGDRIQLVDNTGQTVSNLKVQEVGNGKTAASLGLAGIDVASSVANGQDMMRLSRDVELDALNDGTGVSVNTTLADIQYQLRDGTTGSIDLSPIVSGSATVDKELTLGDVMDVINAAAPDKLRADISQDGDRLVVTDLTQGNGTFALSSLSGSEALEDLGLSGSAAGGVITGRRILGGMNTVLLSSLNGGQGFGELGTVTLTDRSGASATVDLSGAETLQDVVDQLNAANIGVTARINDSRTGIQLEDTTGASTSNLKIADGDGTDTASKLGIAADSEATSVNGGDLHLQVIGYNTLLSKLNGGAGIASGNIVITDSTGTKQTINLSKDTIQTVGDVVNAINRTSLKVRAEINDTGDGIRIRDTGGGANELTIAESGSGRTAADLHILGTAKEVTIDGQTAHAIDGGTTYSITLSSTDTLESLRTKINDLGIGVSAAIFNDGSSKPYRLSLTSEQAGKAGAMVIDTSGLPISFDETVKAQDALLVSGRMSDTGSNLIISSSSNDFVDVLPGVTLHVTAPSSSPVTISIGDSDSDVVTNVKTLVDNYNKFRDKLDEDTKYDTETETKSVLTGDSTALRLDSEFSQLFSQRIYGAGSIHSIAELGVTLKDDGTLQFDQDKLKEKYAADPDAVKEFFTAADTGFSARFDKLAEQLAGENDSLLVSRYNTLDEKITNNQDRIDFLTERLTAERERMTAKFNAMESAISKMQSNMTVVQGIMANLSAYSSSNSSNSSSS